MITATTAGASRRAAAFTVCGPLCVRVSLLRAREDRRVMLDPGRLERRRRIADADAASRVDAVDQRDVLDDRGRLGYRLGEDVVFQPDGAELRARPEQPAHLSGQQPLLQEAL